MTTAFRAIRGFIGLSSIIALMTVPQFAAAQSVGVVTKQLLPPNATTCAPLFVSNVVPYIYGGELHSFDVVISDTTYVGIYGMAGDVEIPFNYFTRRAEPNGGIRLHVDTTASIRGSLPVTITLLSAADGTKTCISTISFTTDSEGNVVAGAATVIPSPTPVSPVVGGGSGEIGGSGAQGGVSQPSIPTPSKPSTSPVVNGTTSGVVETIAKACTESGASQLWFILIAIFFVIVAFVGLSQPPVVLRHYALPAALIGVPLVLLIAFWLLVSSCRLSVLIPIILIVAAAIGLYAAYRSSPLMQPVIALPASKTGEDKEGGKK